MCVLKIKDILFPLNTTGKKKQSVVYNLPADHSSVTLEITWSGDRLDVAYTTYHQSGGRNEYTPERTTYENGHDSDEDIFIRRSTIPRIGVVDNAVYFNCTNVTYLEINGEQFI